MPIAVYRTSMDAARAAASSLVEMLDNGELRVLGVATGSSPSPVYRELGQRGDPRLRALAAFALDEYVGLPPGHPESYRAVVDREVTVPLGLEPQRVHVPGEVSPERYEQLIVEHGGVDAQLLGIGANGHIGFNEPGSAFDSRTRRVALDASTRAANARFFDSIHDVPTESVTQGIGTILDSRRIVVLAFGSAKAAAVAAAIEGPRTEAVPASVLRDHRRVSWYLDEDAASHLG